MRKLVLALAGIVVFAGWSHAVTLSDKMHGTIRDGNRHYEDGEHERALEKYLAAEQLDSTHSVPHFNAGDALYRLGKFPEGARQFLNSSASPTDSIAAMSYYNLGNSLFKAGDLQSAADAYRRSLLINPDDDDAKYNFELALRMMEEQQEQQQQQEQQEQQDEKQEQKDKDDELPNERDKQGEEESQDQSRQDQQQDEESQQPQEQGESQPAPSEITPEELERILAAIEASDKNTQEEMLKKASRRKRISGKDW